MISAAQSSMRIVHVNGGPGVIVSGLVWLLAASIFLTLGFKPSLMAFFFGGMLIHPLSVFIAGKIRRETVPADKALTRLALLTLPILFGGLYIAYIMSVQNLSWFYPIMAIAIGIRYVSFKFIYGFNAYIVLGGCLAIIGVVALYISPSVVAIPMLVGVIEILFGIFLIRKR